MNPNQQQTQQPNIYSMIGLDPTKLNMGGDVNPDITSASKALDTIPNSLPFLGGLAAAAIAPEGIIPEALFMGGGQGLGQGLLNALTGKPLGENVPQEAGGGFAGGLIGGGLSKWLGGALGGAGEDLTTGNLNLTQLMKNKLGIKNGEGVMDTLLKNDAAGADAAKLGSKLQGLYDYHGQITGDSSIPFNWDTFNTHADNALQAIKNNPAAPEGLYDSVNQKIQNVLGMGADGKLNTMSDLNDVLGQFDKGTRESEFGSANWGANRTTGDVLRKTMYDIGDANGIKGPNGESLKAFGNNLSNLRNISDVAQNREGMAKNGFWNTPSLLGTELGAQGLSAMGANPLLAGIIPAGKMGMNLAKQGVQNSPFLAGLFSRAGLTAGKAITEQIPNLTMASSLGGGILGKTLFGQGVSNSEGQSNNQQNNINQLPNQPQNGSNSEGQQSQSNNPANDSHTSSMAQVAQSVNGIQKDDQGHFILPDLNSVQTTIPGQSYTPEQQAADLQKVSQLPFYMQSAAIDQIKTKTAINDKDVGQFLSTHQLSPEQVNMMRQIPNANDQMNTLRDLVKTESGKNLFQSVLNDNPVAQYVKANTDPTGKYAQTLSMMKTIRATAEYAMVHGRVSNFDIQNLSNTPGPGDSAASALAKLDLQQATMADQYARNLPAYGYSLQAGNQQTTQGGGMPPSPSGNFLQSLLSGNQAPQPSPTQQVGALFQTLGLPQ